jgi:Tfp pilus assembly protein PilO
MSLSDRDRKIALAIVPVLLIVVYWFLLLAPKREEAATAATSLGKQQQRLTTAQGKVDQASGARTSFASDYTEVVRLGKAIPSSVDMPGLVGQLDRAANGTGIKFTNIAVGTADGAAAPTPPPSSGSGGGSQPPAAAGGTPAQSAPGSAAEKANNASATSDQANKAAESSGVNAGDTQTSTPAGGGSTAAPGTSGATPPGLQIVPLQLEFDGNFFNLADFFHRVKRLVRTFNSKVVVSGRLVTIESLKYTSDPELFPLLKAELNATIYLVPAGQGTTAGASPQGPADTTPAAGGDSGAAPPAATATPR